MGNVSRESKISLEGIFKVLGVSDKEIRDMEKLSNDLDKFKPLDFYQKFNKSNYKNRK